MVERGIKPLLETGSRTPHTYGVFAFGGASGARYPDPLDLIRPLRGRTRRKEDRPCTYKVVRTRGAP